MINFVVEDIEEGRNLIDNWVDNNAGSPRFTTAPIMNRMILAKNENKDFRGFFNLKKYTNELSLKNYIIPIGVNNDPHNWAGGELSEHKDYPSLFEFIPEYYLNDLKTNNAFLLIDSSLEGYHSNFIFKFFHYECEKYKINPTQIIYVTGNSIVEDCYEEWLKDNPQKNKILAVGYSHFEFDTHCFTQHLPEENDKFPPTAEEQILYKTENLDKIKLFCNLNKKPRAHRVFWYCLLYNNKMLEKGLVSMNKFDYHHESSPSYSGRYFNYDKFKEIKQTLPSIIYGKGNEEKSTDYYVKRFNVDVALDSWVAVISEAQYEDDQQTVFISEKIFKSIAQSQPFLILGNRGSLTELKKMGYKTFEGFIDESYDSKNEGDRFFSILTSLKKIEKIENKLEWYKSMKDILDHNKKLLSFNSVQRLPLPVKKIIKLVLRDEIFHKKIEEKILKYVK